MVCRAAPYGTLFSNIDTGAGLRMFESAGAFGRGPHTGAWTTFWNLRGRRERDRCEKHVGHFMRDVGEGRMLHTS